MDQVFVDNYASLLGKIALSEKTHSLDDIDSLTPIPVIHGPRTGRSGQYPETGDPP